MAQIEPYNLKPAVAAKEHEVRKVFKKMPIVVEPQDALFHRIKLKVERHQGKWAFSAVAELQKLDVFSR